MTDLSHFSDEELERAAGMSTGAPVPAVPVGGLYDHLSDAELEKAAGGAEPEVPKPTTPQMGGFWREPALAASNFVKGAVESIPSTVDFLFGERPRDPNDPNSMARAKHANLVNVARGLEDPKSDTQLTADVQGSQAAAFPMTRAIDTGLANAGIANRPDLEPQGDMERYLAAGSQGAGAAIPFGLTGGLPAAAMNTARGFTGGMGALAGHDVAPNSEIAPLFGGLLGGAVPDAIGAAASSAAKIGRNAFGAYDPENRATEIIAKKLAADKIDPAEITQTIAANPDKPLTLADLGGPATQRMARASLDVPSEGSASATQMLQDRDAGRGLNGPYDMFKQQGTADRVITDIKSALGSDDAFKTATDLIAQRQQQAAPLYEAFRAESPAPARQVQPFMSSPTFRKALNRANAAILDEGGTPLTDMIDYNPAGDPISVKGAAFPPDVLDRIKQGIDDTWLAAKAGGDAGEARTANTLRSRYLQFMDSKYPNTYPAARQAYAGPSASLEALKQGAEVFKNAPQEVASTLGSLPPESRDMFRIGVQQALISRVQNTADGANEVRALFGNPAKRESIAAAFDNPDALKQLSQNLGLENRMYQTKGLLGGSRTAPSALDQADLSHSGFGEAGHALAHAAGGNWKGAIMTAARPLINRMGEGANADTTSILAQRLLNPDQQQNAATLALVQALMGQKPQPRALPSPLPGMLAAPLISSAKDR
jgi:hypothetical protein